MNVRIIFKNDIWGKLSIIWILAHIRQTIVKRAMCRAPKQFKPCRFTSRVKSETEQAYHMKYLVYV
jgi:hypothetical protein